MVNNKVNIAQFVDMIAANYITGDYTGGLGNAGVGKTQAPKLAAEMLGIDYFGISAATLNPLDAGGLPVPVGDSFDMLPPKSWPKDGKGIFHIDEITRPSSPMVYNALLGFIDTKTLGSYTLPDGYQFVFTGNHTSNQGYTLTPDTAFLTRGFWFTVEMDWREHVIWMLKEEYPTVGAAFHRYHEGEYLLDDDPNNDELQRARPRTWQLAYKKLAQGLPSEIEQRAICGVLGTQITERFYMFKNKIWGQLPDGEEILSNPSTAYVPNDSDEDRLGKLAILATSAGKAANPDLMHNLVQYCERLPREFALIAITDATRNNAECKTTRAYVTWKAKNDDLLRG